jgi:ADP-ribose pyrophosphatase YjhB (NUDIX family)
MRVRASTIIQQGERILFLKYHYGGEDVYNLPGGNPDPGESLPDCVKRELQEELGIDIEVLQLTVVAQGVAQRSKGIESVLHMVFEGQIRSGTLKINPEETSALDAVWLSYDELENAVLYPAINQQLIALCKSSFQNCPLYIERFDQRWL